MKEVAAAVAAMSQIDINTLERSGNFTISVANEPQVIGLDDVEIMSEDIPGWLVSSEDRFTVALDITLTEDLKQEGIARELINRIQNMRKDAGFEVTDKIKISILNHSALNQAIENHREYIASQTLAREVCLVDSMPAESSSRIELDSDFIISIKVEKIDV
jgi:isoleucyl-tRNA synthetase